MNPTQVAIYARVSSEQQAETHTIASQVAALRERVGRRKQDDQHCGNQMEPSTLHEFLLPLKNCSRKRQKFKGWERLASKTPPRNSLSGHLERWPVVTRRKSN